MLGLMLDEKHGGEPPLWKQLVAGVAFALITLPLALLLAYLLVSLANLR